MAIDKDSEPHLLVDTIDGTKLDCSEWDGSSYSSKSTVDLSDVATASLNITHYYGISQVYYPDIYAFAKGHYTRWPYVQIRVHRVLEGFRQYVFNKKKLVTKQRMQLLKFFVDRHSDGAIGTVDLMTELYSIRWVLHPDSETEHTKLQLYLESLVRSGDVREVNHDYVLTGQALSTIEKYEEDERRHSESVGVQRRMWWLTLIIALLTLVQAGIVKLPVLLDFTGLSK